MLFSLFVMNLNIY